MRAKGGDLWRLLHPLVQDFLGGLAAARPPERAALTVDPTVERPEAAPTVGSWPPEVGRYDADGLNVQAPGELAGLGLALGFPEVRAFLVGFAQRASPGRLSVQRIADMANSLAEVAGRSELPRDGFVAAWEALFGGGLGRFTRSAISQGLVTQEFAICRASIIGVHLADADIGISLGDGVGGSLRISGTFCRGERLSLTKSDRRLAQLPPELHGVNAVFVATGEQIGVQLTGLPAKRLKWDIHLTVKKPLRKETEDR